MYEKTPIQRRMMRTGEAARYIRRSENKTRALVAKGLIPVQRDEEGGPFLFDQRDLDAFIERMKETR